MPSTTPSTDASGIPSLLVILSTVTLVCSGIIAGTLAMGGWVPMFGALAAVWIGAVIVVLAIAKTLNSSGEPEEQETPAEVPVRDMHAARRRPAAPIPADRPLSRR